MELFPARSLVTFPYLGISTNAANIILFGVELESHFHCHFSRSWLEPTRLSAKNPQQITKLFLFKQPDHVIRRVAVKVSRDRHISAQLGELPVSGTQSKESYIVAGIYCVG